LLFTLYLLPLPPSFIPVFLYSPVFIFLSREGPAPGLSQAKPRLANRIAKPS